ncbi:MAG: hypothetical protein R2698_04910 [Microthrixaceae bacterium]
MSGSNMSGAATDSPERTAGRETDWTDQVTDLVVDVVDTVRDKTTGPVLLAARALVYGIVAMIAALILLIVLVAVTGRAIALVPVASWICYLALGAILSAIGLLCWTKRYPS